MPSPLAHALGGATVALVADLMPGRPIAGVRRAPSDSRLVVVCACLAALPDADLLLPIAHRTVSHSLVAVATVGLLMIIAAAVTGKVTAKIGVTCVAAYASHLLLDWLQTDPTGPHGLQMLWPFSSTWFISGWNIFRGTERQRFLELATMKSNFVAVAQEMAILVPIVAGLWLIRVKTAARFAAEMPRRDHPP
jgi:membrane-bound metal-dependent hydrolase YbcI (DUF457 family)